MIVHHGGVIGDVSNARLPADAYPALFAYSLNRKLRYLYDGEYFDFVDKDGAGSYPNRTPSADPYEIPHQSDLNLVDLGTRLDIGRENMDPKLGDAELFGGTSTSTVVTVGQAVETSADSYYFSNGRITFNSDGYNGFTYSSSSTAGWAIFLTPLTYTIADIDPSAWYIKSGNGSRTDGLANVLWFVFEDENGARFFVPMASQSNPSFTQYRPHTYDPTVGGYTIAANASLNIVDIPEGFELEPGMECRIAQGSGANSRNSGWNSSYSNYFQIYQAVHATTAYPKITKIYDQKAKHGVPVQDAVQLDADLQPRLGYSDNPAGQKEYKAIFNNKEYFDIPNLAPFIGQNFTITAIGDGGDVPRPMIGVWGDNDIITYEPSDLTTRFAFNSNMGSIIQQDGRVTQCFSGYDWTQNYTNVMSVKTAGEKAHRTRGVINPDFTNLSIGRQDQRLYAGEFSEAVMHLDELTSLGSDQLFSTTRTQYGY